MFFKNVHEETPRINVSSDEDMLKVLKSAPADYFVIDDDTGELVKPVKDNPDLEIGNITPVVGQMFLVPISILKKLTEFKSEDFQSNVV